MLNASKKRSPSERMAIAFLLAIALTTANHWSIALQSAQASSTPEWWSNIFRSPPPGTRGPGGSRGEEFCMIALNINATVIWSDRPTFTWRSIAFAPDAPGAPIQIELRKDGDSTVFWSRPITAATQINLPNPTSTGTPTPSIYQLTSEIPLEPGQRYEWRIVRRALNTAWLPLQPVTSQERDRITQELQTLNQQLTRQGVTGEAAIVRRADYFASKGLWSEFWKEVLSVQNPSTELRTAIDRAFGLLCD